MARRAPRDLSSSSSRRPRARGSGAGGRARQLLFVACWLLAAAVSKTTAQLTTVCDAAFDIIPFYYGNSTNSERNRNHHNYNKLAIIRPIKSTK